MDWLSEIRSEATARKVDEYARSNDFSPDMVWYRLFKKLGPDYAMKILACLYTKDELETIPQSVKIEWDEGEWTKFMDCLTAFVALEGGTEKAGEKIDYDLDDKVLDAVAKMNGIASRIVKERKVSESDKDTIEAVYELVMWLDDYDIKAEGVGVSYKVEQQIEDIALVAEMFCEGSAEEECDFWEYLED